MKQDNERCLMKLLMHAVLFIVQVKEKGWCRRHLQRLCCKDNNALN